MPLWRQIYLVAVGLRLWLAVGDLYIHPDEHFQLMLVITRHLLGFQGTVPWEFASDAPARSSAVLYLVYGPLMAVARWWLPDVNPRVLLYLARLQMCLVLMGVTDWCVYHLMPIKTERVKAALFVATLYITLTYQLHTFSNSVETVLVLLCLVVVQHVREDMEVENMRQSGSSSPQVARFVLPDHHLQLALLGCMVAVGCFNRITFPAFLVAPGWFVARFLLLKPLNIPILLASFAATLALLVAIDTAIAGLDTWVLAPWNNLVYNLDTANLALHGLHPYYQHLVINIPQIAGPGLVWLVYRNRYRTTVPFLSMLLALAVLSLVPHQELRFLVPLLPLCCCCFDLTPYQAHPGVVRWLMRGWFVFNALLAVLMGVYHQGGVVPAMAHVHDAGIGGTVVWWRTYSPPDWMLGTNPHNTTTVDLMGAAPEHVALVLAELVANNTRTHLVAPTWAVAALGLNTTQVFHHREHINLDHFDTGNWDTFVPGLGIYAL